MCTLKEALLFAAYLAAICGCGTSNAAEKQTPKPLSEYTVGNSNNVMDSDFKYTVVPQKPKAVEPPKGKLCGCDAAACYYENRDVCVVKEKP